MPRPKLPAGPGRPRSDRRIAMAVKLQPEVWGLCRTLADTAFGGNFTRALEHCIRIGSVGLDPADPPVKERGR